MVSACGNDGNSQKGLADGATGNMDAYESSSVNAIVQAKPEIMILPADKTLREFGDLKQTKIDGETYNLRDYQKFLLDDPNFKNVTAYIHGKFIELDYPLTDFEQNLKTLSNKKATAMADNLAQDSKTQLLATARPDIILEIDYNVKKDVTRSTGERNSHYLINAIDPYTDKVIATISADGLKGPDALGGMSESLDKNLPKLTDDIQKYFNDILTRGREVTVTVNVDNDSNQKLTDESIDGDTYADAIVDFIKRNTVKGAYKMQVNTADQLSFGNVRIKVLNDDGTQYGVYDWTRDLQKYLRRELGLTTENRSQGLGEIVLTVKGM